MVKAVFIDFDSTLYSHFTNCVPESTAKAINEARKNGVKFFICSGRSLFELDQFDLSSITIDGYILNNGQVIYDQNKQKVFDNPLTGELYDRILELYNAKNVPIFLHTEFSIFTNFVNEKVETIQKRVDSEIPMIKEYEGEKVYMISSFYTEHEDWQTMKNLQSIANITFWQDGAINVFPKTSSKAIGAKKVIDMLGIKQEETMGIGDSENDVDMLKFCNISVAVGNAIDEIKEIADYVTDHIESNGIYNALKYYNVI